MIGPPHPWYRQPKHALDHARAVEDIWAEAQAVHEHLVAIEARSEEGLRTRSRFGPNGDLSRRVIDA